MEKRTIYIDDYSNYSYKLSANGIHTYHDRALEEAKNLYLKIYDRVYRNLMGFDFNPLWTPDTKSINDLDFKDDFGDVSYFYFNICLLRILSEEYDIKVEDRTASAFNNQKYIYSFLKELGVEIKKSDKRERLISKHKIKIFVTDTLKKSPGRLSDSLKKLKEIVSLEKVTMDQRDKRNTIYLYVHSVGGMKLQSYLDWRYSDFLQTLEKVGYNIVIFSTIDFQDSRSVGHEFININRLVSKGELLKSFLKSFFVKLKVILYSAFNNVKPKLKTSERFFLKNLPKSFFYPIRELYGIGHLFKQKGRGLLIIKGPVNNKCASSLFYQARNHGVRTLVIAPRILTPTRFSNQFIDAHFEDKYPSIFPHSMIVTDRISYETVQSQTDEICTYPVKVNAEQMPEVNGLPHEPFSVTLILQKKNEIEEMVDEALKAIENISGIVLNLKVHPTFPIPDWLADKYSKYPNVKILPINTPLAEAIKKSDVGITSYSTAALDFIKAGKPIIWQKNVTANSLFFYELHRRIGLSVNNPGEMRILLSKMKDSQDYYHEEKKLQYEQYQDNIFDAEVNAYKSISMVLNEELQKI